MALLGSALAGCAGPAASTKRSEVEPPAAKPEAPAYTAGTKTTFPLLEVRGKPYEIGHAIGKRFAEQIRQGFEGRGKWWHDLKAFAMAQPANVYDTFLAAARKHAPSVVEELRGWADGCGVPFREMMTLNLKAEYGALRDRTQVTEPQVAWASQPGCSTIVLADGDRFILVHNEDGDKAYIDRMFMLRIHPEGKPSVLCASYPGILPGNAPWINDAGVIMTTNFIYTKDVRLGVGRYFLDRLAMEARTLQEALRTCQHPDRAYAFHHVIGSVRDKRVVSLEVTPARKLQVDISGLFLHTNHLIHEPLAKEAQNPKYVGSSSMTRWKVLSKWRESVKHELGKLEEADLVAALASHDGKPYSPCRHPEGKVTGATLLTAVFRVPGETVRIYKDQPCNGRHHDYRTFG
jgi:predicted choloylglycine hydrolase